MATAAENRKGPGSESFLRYWLRLELASKATAFASQEFPAARRWRSRKASSARRARYVPPSLAEFLAGASEKTESDSFFFLGFFIHTKLRHVSRYQRVRRANEIMRRINLRNLACIH